ncbi:STAS domain-containing protein [Candidatus Oscillochloris fontis]|uniref:STAS domain-containing protein n=1 Tax=Candidatus Oscillochloris fontis TaxID=2496868 RepID=UPI00101D92E9|nr:STAS domain-containing protein [Candidatus Oscillochloris fontis]
MFANPLLSRFFIMRHTDDDLRRRGQNLLIVLWILIAISLLSIPTSIIHGRVGSLLNTISVLPVAMLLLWMTHRGWVGWVTMIMLTINTMSLILVPVFGSAEFSVIAYYFIINTFIAGIVLRPIMVWGVLVLNIAALALTAVLAQQFPQEAPSLLVTSMNVGLLLIFATMIVILDSTTMMRTLSELRQARAETLHANQALAESNASLERLVADRTAILSATLAEHEAHAQALQDALAAQERMHDLVTELSLPVIPVRHDTLVVPLIGSLDSTRANILLQRVLTQIEKHRARALILDVTGLPLVDTQVAKIMLTIAEAARLLGTDTTLVGIRPEVAQALVSLGVELPRLTTYATLEQALD